MRTVGATSIVLLVLILCTPRAHCGPFVEPKPIYGKKCGTPDPAKERRPEDRGMRHKLSNSTVIGGQNYSISVYHWVSDNGTMIKGLINNNKERWDEYELLNIDKDELKNAKNVTIDNKDGTKNQRAKKDDKNKRWYTTRYANYGYGSTEGRRVQAQISTGADAQNGYWFNLWIEGGLALVRSSYYCSTCLCNGLDCWGLNIVIGDAGSGYYYDGGVYTPTHTYPFMTYTDSYFSYVFADRQAANGYIEWAACWPGRGATDCNW